LFFELSGARARTRGRGKREGVGHCGTVTLPPVNKARPLTPLAVGGTVAGGSVPPAGGDTPGGAGPGGTGLGAGSADSDSGAGESDSEYSPAELPLPVHGHPGQCHWTDSDFKFCLLPVASGWDRGGWQQNAEKRQCSARSVHFTALPILLEVYSAQSMSLRLRWGLVLARLPCSSPRVT
jgi:hypothetical protein